MTVLITGAGGQVGHELLKIAPQGVAATGLAHADLDITDAEAVSAYVTDTSPELIINAAAYTAVDKAESEREAAYAVNETGARNLAEAAEKASARLIHISTDFIFDGASSHAYRPDDTPGPLGVYGASKLAGEVAVRRECPEALIIRTSWVYSAHGGNFVKTMLRLMAERQELNVVTDQIGTPSWARELAAAIWRLSSGGAWGETLHWSNSGVASWYDFAMAIAEEGAAGGLLAKAPCILPIPASDYPTPAKRPGFSLLDKSATWGHLGEPARHWRVALRDMLKELKDSGNG